MGKGGGGTQTVQQTIPEWMHKYIDNNYEFGKKIADTPFQPYTGQGVAPLNSQQQGIGMIQNNANNGVGLDAVNQGIRNTGAAGNYSPLSVGYSGPSGGQVQQYMNPYTQNVIDTTMNEIGQQQGIVKQQNGRCPIRS
ncbi:MAG: hypothetical protein VB141_12655 [Burkholderia gladioli]